MAVLDDVITDASLYEPAAPGEENDAGAAPQPPAED